MSTKELQTSLAWRSADLEVTVCALLSTTWTRAQAEATFRAAVGDAFPRGAALRVDRTSTEMPWFASVDAVIRDVDELQGLLPALLQRLLDQGALAAWAGFEGSVLAEEDIFSEPLATHHYAVASGSTVALALDDETRESDGWKKTVADCRARLVRRVPAIAPMS